MLNPEFSPTDACGRYGEFNDPFCSINIEWNSAQTIAQDRAMIDEVVVEAKERGIAEEDIFMITEKDYEGCYYAGDEPSLQLSFYKRCDIKYIQEEA